MATAKAEAGVAAHGGGGLSGVDQRSSGSGGGGGGWESSIFTEIFTTDKSASVSCCLMIHHTL